MMTIEKQQLLLAYLGYYQLRYSQKPRVGDLAIDRIPGPALSSAIRRMQQQEQIAQDGIWGPATEAAALDAVAAGRLAPPPKKPENPEDIPAAVWAYLTAQGFPPESVAGIMGNIDAESNMQPTNLEDYYQARLGYTDRTYTAAVDDGSYVRFTQDQAGYGLCQWTWHTRKAGLLDKARSLGVSIGDLRLQLAYLMQELTTGWPSLVRQLKNHDISVYTATESFMRSFENPADQSPAAVSRRASISQMYYDRYKENERNGK